jgi:hypothetical protein
MENNETYKYNVICEYWNRHPLINWKFTCNCKDKYKFEAIDLKVYMRDVLGKIYIQDITEEQKRDCYLDLKQKWLI